MKLITTFFCLLLISLTASASNVGCDLRFNGKSSHETLSATESIHILLAPGRYLTLMQLLNQQGLETLSISFSRAPTQEEADFFALTSTLQMPDVVVAEKNYTYASTDQINTGDLLLTTLSISCASE